MIKRKLILFLILTFAPGAIFAGHLLIESVKQDYQSWLDGQIERVLARRVIALKIEVGIDKQGNPAIKTGDTLTCADWQSAALLYKMQLESSNTSIASIYDYVGGYLDHHNS